LDKVGKIQVSVVSFINYGLMIPVNTKKNLKPN
jgi:hypothetical protein